MKKHHAPTLLFLSLFLLFSCAPERSGRLQREELFVLEIGRMEDNLDLVEHYGVPYTEKSRLFMRDGLFYIGNGNSSKVMEFNSYGDILSLYYSPEKNPDPILLDAGSESSAQSSRKAYPYSFNRVGEIAVTGSGQLLVEERAQEYQTSFDEELGVSLNTIILRFSGSGEVLDYLGQEGVGGTPFPYVEALYVTDEDGIAVVSRGTDRWIAFMFDPNGNIVTRNDFQPDRIPLPAEGGDYAVPSIKAVFPSPDGEELMVMTDYYRLADAKGSVDFAESAVLVYNAASGSWTGRVVLPEKRVGDETIGVLDGESFVTIYDVLGIDAGGNLFFMAPESEDNFELMIMGRDGSVKNRSTVLLEDDQIIYRDFFLSPEGIVCGLLAYEFEAKVVWWRSDKVMENSR